MIVEAWNKRAGIKVTCRECQVKRDGQFYKCITCSPSTWTGYYVCARCRKAHETMHMLESFNLT